MVCIIGVNVAATFTPFLRKRIAFAFCILHFALLAAGCASASPPLSRALLTAPAQLDNTRQLQSDLIAATTMPGVQRATWGIAVQSLARNERLFDLNPQTLMVPASVAKLVSVATAVDAVGWDYRFTTTLRASGPIENGVLRGDLIVVGTGDPAIGGRGGDDLSQWADALKAIGLHRVDGRVVADDDVFEDPRPGFGWTWDDLGYSTGAMFGALNFGENKVAFGFRPNEVAGQPTIVDFGTNDDALVQNLSMTGPRGTTPLIWPELELNAVPAIPIVRGSLPVGGMPVTLQVSVGDPTVRFARALQRRLDDAGIEVRGGAIDADESIPPVNVDSAPIIYTYRSHPLSDIVQPLLKESINLYGEAVQRLNASGPLPHTNDQALDGMKRRLASWGIAAEGFQLVDGSGLSRRDVIAADTLLTILSRMYDPAGTSPWMTALPIAGVDGTLAARMKGTPADNNVRAKTGTMSNVRSLAGYLRTRDGEPVAFVAIVDNFEGTGAQANAALDAIAVRLASFSR